MSARHWCGHLFCCWCRWCVQDAFKLAVFGSVEGAPEKQKSGGTKRKTEDPDAKVGGVCVCVWGGASIGCGRMVACCSGCDMCNGYCHPSCRQTGSTQTPSAHEAYVQPDTYESLQHCHIQLAPLCPASVTLCCWVCRLYPGLLHARRRRLLLSTCLHSSPYARRPQLQHFDSLFSATLLLPAWAPAPHPPHSRKGRLLLSAQSTTGKPWQLV